MQEMLAEALEYKYPINLGILETELYIWLAEI
jgi:hypothetical protein